ncbi:MAG: hypothetical protein ACP5KS_12830, partial [Candidatus Hydrogenedens sp.]
MKKQFIFALLLLSFLIHATVAFTQRNEPFIQEVRTFFREKEGLIEGNIRYVVYLQTYGVFVLSHSGNIQNYKNNQWHSISNDTSIKPTYMTGAGNFVFISDHKQAAQYNLDENKWDILSLPIEQKINGLYATILSDKQLKLFVICETKIICCGLNSADSKIINDPGTKIYSIAVGGSGDIFVGTQEGIYQYDSSKSDWQWLLPEDNKRRWAPRNVKALTFDKEGNLWFGSKEGVGKYNRSTWALYTGAEGLPWNEFLSAVSGEKDDVVWFATTRGAIRHEKGKFDYRFSHRWLMNDFVNSIAVEPNGNAWFATPEGLSLIERKLMNFDEKSDYFIQQVETRHNRDGYVTSCKLKEPFNTDTWDPSISDNDGLYTAMYGAGHAFRYAVTKDPKSKEIAKRSFFACKRLVDITGRGMPARFIIPIDWHEPVNEIMGAEYNAYRQKTDPLWKQIVPRFVTSSDGKYMWKCDTSSDELIGHYFFYGIYYDLVAETEEEKQPVREVV